LEVYEVEHRPTVVHPTPQVPQIPQVSQIQTTGSEMMGKLVVRSQKKGPVGISKCEIENEIDKDFFSHFFVL
jgi:hypothetical protein